MASNSFKLHVQTIHLSSPLPFPLSKTLLQPRSISFANLRSSAHISFFPTKPLNPSKLPSFSLHCSLSSSASSPTPPTSKQEAVLQAKTSLSTTLQKPLNNTFLIRKLKKQSQPRYRVEIPVVDDSLDSIAQLAFEVFGDRSVKRKGSPVRILLVWGNPTLKERGVKAFESLPLGSVAHTDLASGINVDDRILNSADLAVFLAPEDSGLAAMEVISERLYPKPVVLFNPKWGFEEESGFGEMSGFVGSFEVIYAFLGLEVRGILSRRKGVIFKCVRDGVLSGEKWYVLVEEEEEEEEGKLKVVSRFKSRPSITEVESVLYNMMAVNSPITKSAKFLRDFVSNITGKK
ncbi:hypothetical protein Dimus_019097 [Dionaea muscipula]